MRRLACTGALALLALAPAAQAWTWPASGPVLRPFTLGEDPYSGGQHRGIDVGAPADAVVLAPAAGTVTFAGSVPTSGRTVTIQTADGYAVTLTHLGSLLVVKGGIVAEGDAGGPLGPSGGPEGAEGKDKDSGGRCRDAAPSRLAARREGCDRRRGRCRRHHRAERRAGGAG